MQKVNKAPEEKGIEMKKFYKRFAVALAAAAMIMLSGSVNVSAAGVKDVFDAEYYADSYEDLKAAFGYNEAALYNHYITFGLTEGRCASLVFDVVEYRRSYQDLEEAFGDNWDAYVDHYMNFGIAEGRTAGVTRNADSSADQTQEQQVNPGNKVVYLTFDDGPGRYTQKLLDILDKYDVKATFFVTNQYPKYQNLIAEEYERGHTVAIHSYSHDYSRIYQSEEAFYSDIEAMNDICEELTGTRATIIRFPGGSSNTISRNYCSGIMSALTRSTASMGYLYADWNVSGGDGGETTSAAQVKANVINGLKANSVSVVLLHDTKGFSVNAVEDIIVWGLANGYTFLPMDNTSPMAHHGVNN